jgi:uncharacterized protein YjbI with pentapeptide repeats
MEVAAKSQGITLVKPKSMWTRKVKLDLKPLFKALGKSVTHVATLKVEELGNDAIEAVVSLGLDTPVEELAYLLVKRATLEALLTLTKESLSHVNQELCENDLLSERVGQLLEGITVSFGKDFFTKSVKLPFIKEISVAYCQWLCDVGVTPVAAQAISLRLPAYFTFALAHEWRTNSAKYKPLAEEVDSPFAAAEAAERGWLLYFSFLKRRISENIFDEPFGLSQIYVPLNAYYIEPKSKSTATNLISWHEEKRVCVHLDTELKQWLSTKDKGDALRVISGGPGSGKSSFTKVFCCELAESGMAKPIYIPLHLIDPTRDVTQEVERFVRDEGLLGFSPLDPDRGEDDLLIVFDGLDELASMGKVAAQVARDFVQAVERMIERRNLGSHPIFVLLSGREVIVQENDTEFRRPKQVLTILPYYVPDNKSMYLDPKNILAEDLRQKWWKNYGELTGSQFSGLPTQLQLPEIDEITAQPLLNYLVALSFRRGKLDFTRTLNLNSVYADLVGAVHERAYEKSRTFRPISHLTDRQFVRVLEEIGLAAWHGSDGRSTSVRNIMQHCQQSGLETLLKSFTEGAEEGVTKLLAAFFFRRNGETVGDDAAFVFTHKSFGEYLTARRIVRGLERMVVERIRRQENTDEGFDVNEALAFWLKLAGPAPLTEYLQIFLRREIAQRPDHELSAWQDTLIELMSATMERLMPVERLGNLTFAASVRYDINASTALMVALNACSIALRRMATLQMSTETTFGNFLRRNCPQRAGPQNPVLYSALSYLDVSGQCLDMIDLYGANLDFTRWRSCKIHYGNMEMSSLESADFTDAFMSYCRFGNARLERTIFRNSRIMGSQLYASISDVDFDGADLRTVEFEGATLSGCSFKESVLIGSNLNKSTSIQDCIFSGATVGKEDKELLNWFSRAKEKGRVEGELLVNPDDKIKRRPSPRPSKISRRTGSE